VTRMLVLISSAQRRGAEVSATALAAALVGRGHDVEIVALAPGPPGTASVDATVPTDGIGSTGLVRLRRRARDADVVLGYGGRTLPVGTLVTAGGPPLVYRSIGDLLRWVGPGRARRTRVGFELRRAARVVPLWDAVADDLVSVLGVASERVTVIPNARDPERFRPPTSTERTEARRAFGMAEDAICLAVVGALSEEKRVGLAIEAARFVPGAVLLLAGDGPERSVLEPWTRNRGVDARFLGNVDDVRRVLHAADVVLSTSTTEGLQGSLIEAGLCGVPAVATAVGGTSTIVDADTGALVPGDASAGAIADSIRWVLARRRRLGPAARERCLDRFDVAGVTDQWEALLTEVADHG
jgi:glycosyltransferase involved in cell wall biosynthesis